MNFLDLSYEWLEDNHKYSIKERSYLRYECLLRCNALPLIGEIDINELTPRVMQHYLNLIRENKSARTGKCLSASSYNSLLIVLNMIFEYAVDFELLENNPMKKIKRIKQEKTQSTAFTKEEQIKIENYIDKQENDEYFPIILCFYTGLRIGELVALTYKDINLKTGVLTINKTKYKTKENGKWIYKTSTPKTKTSIREIPLPFFLVEELRRLKKKNLSKYICVRNDGTPMDDKFLRNRFSSLEKAIKIRKLNFHCIRHTFATRALENRIDIKTLSEILGHANASTTLDIYAHTLSEHKKAMMRNMKRLNGKSNVRSNYSYQWRKLNNKCTRGWCKTLRNR